MAITDHKISAADISGVNVIAQPTILHGTAHENKAVFDNFPNMIVQKYNAALEEIERASSTEIDRDVLEYYASIGWTPDN